MAARTPERLRLRRLLESDWIRCGYDIAFALVNCIFRPLYGAVSYGQNPPGLPRRFYCVIYIVCRFQEGTSFVFSKYAVSSLG